MTLTWFYVFFFQAEDGIRDYKVTGVQTCALPIFGLVAAVLGSLLSPQAVRDDRGRLQRPIHRGRREGRIAPGHGRRGARAGRGHVQRGGTGKGERGRVIRARLVRWLWQPGAEIGRASCRERV